MQLIFGRKNINDWSFFNETKGFASSEWLLIIKFMIWFLDIKSISKKYI